MTTTKDSGFQVIEDPCYGPILVDLGSYRKVEGWGTNHDTTWDAYGQPFHGRMPIGYYGSNLVLTDEAYTYVPTYRVVSRTVPVLTSIRDIFRGDGLFHAEHPKQYARIASAWDRLAK